MSGKSQTVLQLFEHRVANAGTRTALRHRVDERWLQTSWKEWWELSERVAAGLHRAGVEPGDRVLLLAETRFEWLVCDVAIMMLGAIGVPVHPSRTVHGVSQILSGATPRAAIVSNPEQLAKIVAHRDELCAAIWFDAEVVHGRRERGLSTHVHEVVATDDDWAISLDELSARGRRALADDASQVAMLRRRVTPQSVATVVHTSGTLGAPRGAMLSHRNLVAQVHALAELHLFGPDERQILFLPLAHMFARVLYLSAVAHGHEIAICDDLSRLLVDARDVRPTYFAGVPALFESLRRKLEREAAAQPLGDQIFRIQERVGATAAAADRGLRREAPSLLRAAGRGLLSKLRPDRARQVLGGSLRFAFCGGAPLRPQTAAFFDSFGVDVLEGYGLTETSALATLNVPGSWRHGSVGQVLPSVEVTIAEDDEILVRGPTVIEGYWNDQSATHDSLDADGWFSTGDLGRFDRQGFLFVTGRKKNVIVTSGGKTVAPDPIERAIEALPVVQTAIVFGDKRPFVVALVVLDEGACASWAAEHGIAPATVHHDPKFRSALTHAIAESNERGAGYAAVRRFAIIDTLQESAGEVTATGKVRRDVVGDNCAQLLDELYETGSDIKTAENRPLFF